MGGPVPVSGPSRRIGRARVTWWCRIGWLGGATAGAAPALAQNAAVIPVSAVVLDVSGDPAVLGVTPGGWLAAAGLGLPGGTPRGPHRVEAGALMVVPETIEPDRLRIRLEYVGN